MRERWGGEGEKKEERSGREERFILTCAHENSCTCLMKWSDHAIIENTCLRVKINIELTPIKI